MVKIMLNEPVGGMISVNQVAARSAQYLEAKGDVTEELKELFDVALVENKSLSFIAKDGAGFLVPARNISFILEIPDAQIGQVS